MPSRIEAEKETVLLSGKNDQHTHDLDLPTDGAEMTSSQCAVCTTSCVSCGIEVLVWWARYHLAVGVDQIFLYIHDPSQPSVGSTTSKALNDPQSQPVPELVKKVKKAMHEKVVVLPTSSLRHREDKIDVVAMQERNVADAIRRGKALGFEWLFHFDDDELLYLTTPPHRGSALLRKALGGSGAAFNIRIDNLEVQKTCGIGSSTYNYFTRETYFKLRVGLHADGTNVAKHDDPRYFVSGGNPATGGDGMTKPYLSYWNGKSAGRLSDPGLKPCGVHFFGSDNKDASSKTTKHVRCTGIVLLHYPFCHYNTWRHKFNVLDASQRSDWGHYRAARLAIMEACGPNGGGEETIIQFYRDAVCIPPPGTNHDDTVALSLPHKASPSQEWRSGIYDRVEAKTNVGRLYRKRPHLSPQSVAEENNDDSEPASFLYSLPEQGIWLVGSTPGATQGAAVAYDTAESPTEIAAPFRIFTGTDWTPAEGGGIGAVAGSGPWFAQIRAADVVADLDDDVSEPPKKERAGPDHARLAAIVVKTLDQHPPYQTCFWAAVVAAAAREPPELLADNAVERALAAGAKAVGTTAVAAALVAERLASDAGSRNAVRRAVAEAQRKRLNLLHSTGDVVFLAMPNTAHVQSWRAGLYVGLVHDSPSSSSDSSSQQRRPAVVYKRIRERPSDQDSFLYRVADRGMWLVGSTPGSTTGGLVAYDAAAHPDKLATPWHVYDGKSWVQAPDISVSPIPPSGDLGGGGSAKASSSSFRSATTTTKVLPNKHTVFPRLA